MNYIDLLGEPPKKSSKTYLFIVLNSDWRPIKNSFIDTLGNDLKVLQVNQFNYKIEKCSETGKEQIRGKATLNRPVRHLQFIRWLGLEADDCRVFPIVGQGGGVQTNNIHDYCEEKYIQISEPIHWKKRKDEKINCSDPDEQINKSHYCCCPFHIKGTIKYEKYLDRLDVWGTSESDDRSNITSLNTSIGSDANDETDSWYSVVNDKRKQIETICKEKNRIASEQGYRLVYSSEEIMDQTIEEEVEIFIKTLDEIEENQEIYSPKSEPSFTLPFSRDVTPISYSEPTTPFKFDLNITIVENNEVDRFIDEKCIIELNRKVGSKYFYDQYEKWCRDRTILYRSNRGKNGLPGEMTKRNYIRKQFGSRRCMHYFGIDLI